MNSRAEELTIALALALQTVQMEVTPDAVLVMKAVIEQHLEAWTWEDYRTPPD